jgi:hypothetical protein
MMNPTMLAGLALAGLAAYGMPGLSKAPAKPRKRARRKASSSLSGVKRRKRR